MNPFLPFFVLITYHCKFFWVFSHAVSSLPFFTDLSFLTVFHWAAHTFADLIIVQPRLLSARVAGRATFAFSSSISNLFSTQPSQKMDCF